MIKKNPVGKPKLDPSKKRYRVIRFSDYEVEQFNKLGFSLVDGVRAAVEEFLEKGGRDASNK